MKLLLDNNLSEALLASLNVFHGSSHVRSFGLSTVDDLSIWQFALDNDFAIISKDRDFADLAVYRGHPPKAIWLRIGNSSTSEAAIILAKYLELIQDFLADEAASLLVIPPSVYV